MRNGPGRRQGLRHQGAGRRRQRRQIDIMIARKEAAFPDQTEQRAGMNRHRQSLGQNEPLDFADDDALPTPGPEPRRGGRG